MALCCRDGAAPHHWQRVSVANRDTIGLGSVPSATGAECCCLCRLCALCSTTMQANPSGMCVNCIRSQVDITSGIPKAQSVQCCRGCERYLQPPRTWIACAWESRELLTVCIKRLRGLNKVKLVDAAFVWTEPHSKRIKTKLTVQKEVSCGSISAWILVSIVSCRSAPCCV